MAVRGLVDQVDEALLRLALRIVADEGVAAHVRAPEEGDDRVEHGQAHMLALAGARARQQRGADRLGADVAGELVGQDGAPVGGRALVGAGLHGGQPAQASGSAGRTPAWRRTDRRSRSQAMETKTSFRVQRAQRLGVEGRGGAIAPGRKFWMNTSAVAASRFSAATPPGVFRSSTIERLLRLLFRNEVENPPRRRATWRVWSVAAEQPRP